MGGILSGYGASSQENAGTTAQTDTVSAGGEEEGYLGKGTAAYYEGDYDAAREYFDKVLDEGQEQVFLADTMGMIAQTYQFGLGVEQDCVKAQEWYDKAAAAEE